MELTQEYFDKGLTNLLEQIEAKMVTKVDLKIQLEAQTKELKDYTHQAFETQQEYLDERFGELIVKYDVRDRVEKLEKEFRNFKLKKTIHA